MRLGVAAGVLLAALCGHSALGVEEVKFAELEPRAAGQVVLFYRKGEADSDAAAAVLAAAETLVKASAGERAGALAFKQCDAGQKENKVGMEAKGLTSLPMLFVAVDGQGTGIFPPASAALSRYPSPETLACPRSPSAAFARA
jgi:hypothetical protein